MQDRRQILELLLGLLDLKFSIVSTFVLLFCETHG